MSHSQSSFRRCETLYQEGTRSQHEVLLNKLALCGSSVGSMSCPNSIAAANDRNLSSIEGFHVNYSHDCSVGTKQKTVGINLKSDQDLVSQLKAKKRLTEPFRDDVERSEKNPKSHLSVLDRPLCIGRFIQTPSGSVAPTHSMPEIC